MSVKPYRVASDAALYQQVASTLLTRAILVLTLRTPRPMPPADREAIVDRLAVVLEQAQAGAAQ